MSHTENEKQDPITVMVKPVGSRCNMRCAYCYYLDKGRFSTHEEQGIMSDVLLEKLIRQTIAASPGPVVSFIWHGGEPTLAGIDFYERAVSLQQKYLPRGWQIWNNLQTNGLMLDDDWCAFLGKYGFDVGVSVDGDSITHDTHRRTAGGGVTWEKVSQAVRRLRDHGISADLLCTVNSVSSSEPLRVYRALRDFGTGWIQFIPVVIREELGVRAEGDARTAAFYSVTPENYGRFLCAVFDEWLSEDLGSTDVQLFAETARIWAGGSASVCWMAESCGRVLIAEEDGSVYSCDHFVDTEHRIGSLVSGKLRRMAESPAQREFGSVKKSTLTRQCRSCRWLPCCGGGCPKDRFAVSSDGEAGQYYLCQGLSMFFDHAYRPLMQAMRLSRIGLSSDTIRMKLRARIPSAT